MSASLPANDAWQLFRETEPGAVRVGAPEVESVVAIGPQKPGALVQPWGELGLPRRLKTQRAAGAPLCRALEPGPTALPLEAGRQAQQPEPGVGRGELVAEPPGAPVNPSSAAWAPARSRAALAAGGRTRSAVFAFQTGDGAATPGASGEKSLRHR